MKLPAVEVGGRFFTRYDPNIALDIVERIADGELLSKITAKDAEPVTITKQTFLRWVSTVPELAKAYAAAMQVSAHAFEEKAIDKAERVAANPGSPQNVSAASLLISQYRWSAARRNPTRYSDKGNTQIVVPINIHTSLDLGPGNRTDTVEVPDIYTISIPQKEEITDGEFTEVQSGSEPEPDVSTEIAEEGVLSNAAVDDRADKEKARIRELLKTTEPVVGVSHQPIYAEQRKSPGAPKGPRKRVLTPRASRHPIKDKRNGNAS